jgi:hypothetical protein
MNKQFYLYTHIRPDTNDIFYVGIGSDFPGRYSRAYEFGPNKRNSIWNKIWFKNKKQIIVDIIKIYDNQDECMQAEIDLIKKYGRICHNTGPLANISIGGESKNKDPKKVIQYDLEGNFIRIWNSVAEITNTLKIKDRSIYPTLNGMSVTSNNFIWKWYTEDYLQKITVDIPNRRKRFVYQYDKQCNCINTYKSVFEASSITNIDTASIFKVTNNQRKTAGGYIWSYDNTCDSYYKNKIAQYSIDGELIKIYDNLETVVKDLKLTSRTAIKNCFNGKQKRAYGYIWKKYPELIK